MWGFIKFWVKIGLSVLGVIFIVGGIIIFASAIFSPESEKDTSTSNKPKQSPEQQLVDVRQKIEELPELEEDIFARCIENKSKTAENIRNCQESTQKQIYTLSQELKNLEENLLEQIEK